MFEIHFLQSRDPFHLFRYLLALIVTIYVTVVTLQWLWSWLVWLSGSDRYTTMLRRYLVVQGLRLRFKTFWGDVILCGLLLAALGLLVRAQAIMDSMERTLTETTHVQRTEQRS
jgi:hypothetical protein